jgi:RNA polymerase sigma factor (sigma-70 family)
MSIAEPDAVAEELDVARSDVELLSRFIAVKDEVAFSELVQRHSGIVMGVCRRILRDGHDIDDVFQATFLVLVRDAVRVKKQSSLASWLYGVAYRLAVRVAQQKQRRRETVLVDETPTDNDTLTQLADRYDQQLLDAELNALPERYRQPLVLKYLAGKMPLEIASELGITVGAVEGLLKRGKDELRSRLIQRGVTVGAALLAIQMTQPSVQAACSDTLIEATVQSGLAWNSTSTSPLDPISDRVLELSGKELAKMTTLTKASLVIGLTSGAIALGWGGISHLTSNPSIGRAEAGIVSTLPIVRPAAARLETASLTADPATPKTAGSTSTPDRKVSPRPQASDPSSWDFKRRSPQVIRIEQALTESSEVAFADTPLEEAITFLKEQHGIEMWIDKQSLEEQSVTVDVPINLTMRGTNLESALNLMLQPLQLDYVIKNEVLVITTLSKADELMETRVYNLARIPHLAPQELIDIIVGANGIGGQSGGGGGGVGGAGGSAGLATGETIPNASLISGALWKERDGTGGTAWAGKTTLVILQTQRVHREIVALLDQLALDMENATKATLR